MRLGEGRRAGAAAVASALLSAVLAACVGAGAERGSDGMAGAGPHSGGRSPGAAAASGLPGVGERLRGRIPVAARQVVAVYGDGRNSARATVVLYAERGRHWERVRAWPGHNGKRGWTAGHRAGDNRSPVGVFTLTDAGGVLADPGTRLPYTRSASFAAPRWWARSHWHDFDYVIAIDYNRVKGAPPDDPTRPDGQEKGGGIWLHMDHGSGTSACVSVSRAAMEHLLRTLDPHEHPVVVMGDRASLRA
ncbi:L,D-transpeptidase family protein [Streptomyces hilarionis]|uniref:L,D-transpeptidase family protein n=1 Tax=Streptomyces hilarionis TaxID=2839954 RepID=UPI002119CE5F|nr:L,D-transpeptidase family protein [Streptomyces hilarionis]MCQ9136101.1 L,D-transpeptidase family protein [Streptomyces hilarionis]